MLKLKISNCYVFDFSKDHKFSFAAKCSKMRTYSTFEQRKKTGLPSETFFKGQAVSKKAKFA